MPATKPGEGDTRTPIAQGGSLVKPHQLEDGYELHDTVIKVPPSDIIKKMRQHPEIAERARDWAATNLSGGKPQVTKAVIDSRQALDLQRPDFEAMVSRIADGKDAGPAKDLVNTITKSAMTKLTPDQISKLGGLEKAKQLVWAEAYKLVDMTARKTVADVKLLKREHS